MLNLLLLRHAKSAWDDPTLEDFERPLSRRGAKAAPEMGRHIADLDLKPDLVLCSGAVRTRGTLALVLPELGPPPPAITYDDGLYLAPPALILDRLHALSASPRTVLVVGHNPGLQSLALELIGTGERKAITQVAVKFPTAALAVITFAHVSWSEVRPASGRLTHYVTPRDLD